MGYRECDICGGRHLTHKTRRNGRKPVAISEREMRRRCLLGGRGVTGQLDIALYSALEARDGNRCQRCGVMGPIRGADRVVEPSHVYRRKQVQQLCYDIHNVLTLCRGCHIWWHQYEAESIRWFADRWPDRMDYLDAKVVECRAFNGTIELAWFEEQLRQLREYALQSQE